VTGIRRTGNDGQHRRGGIFVSYFITYFRYITINASKACSLSNQTESEALFISVLNILSLYSIIRFLQGLFLFIFLFFYNIVNLIRLVVVKAFNGLIRLCYY